MSEHQKDCLCHLCSDHHHFPAVKKPNSSLAAMPGSESYQLLEAGDKIEIGDQYLEYDCQTWKAISAHEWCIGDNYSSVFVPMRRRIQNS